MLPMAGGMDLLGLMKDYIVSPDRVVSIKGLDQTIAAGDGGLRIGAAVKIADLAEHAAARKLYPALVTAAEGVGTPQIRNMGTVGGNIMQRPRCWYFRNEEFNCLKKGGSRCFAVEGENQYHAIFGDGPCHIVHPSSLAVPVIAYGGRFRVVGPNGAREIDAGEFFQMPNANLYGENVLQPNEIITHVHPAGAGPAQRGVRSALQAVARLAAGGGVGEPGDGGLDGEVRAHRDGRGGADSVARAGGRARAGRQDDHRSDRDRSGECRGGRRAADERETPTRFRLRRRRSSAPSSAGLAGHELMDTPKPSSPLVNEHHCGNLRHKGMYVMTRAGSGRVQVLRPLRRDALLVHVHAEGARAGRAVGASARASTAAAVPAASELAPLV